MNNRPVILLCATALILMAMYCWQGRYVFLINNNRTIAIGDRWTGCVDYSEVRSTGEQDWKYYGQMLRSEC